MKSCTKTLAALIAAIAAAALFGCSNQAEGDRCNRLAGSNGNDDCEPGLSCQLIGALELCCPYNRAPSVPECVPGSNLPDAATDTGADAAVEAEVPDTGSDASEQAAD